jgi:hypothetical protein
VRARRGRRARDARCRPLLLRQQSGCEAAVWNHPVPSEEGCGQDSSREHVDSAQRYVRSFVVPSGQAPANSTAPSSARVQVHWLDITTRFPNHDTTYEISKCEDLEEHALTRHIELHSSRSSSGSSKKLKLDGIEEDAEEASNPEKVEEKTKPTEGTPKKSIDRTAQSPEAPSVKSLEPSIRPHIDTASLIERSKKLAAALEAPELKAPEIVERPPEVEEPKEEKKPDPKEYALSVKSYHFDVHDDSSDSDIYDYDDRRMSSQTARPSTSDYSAYYNSLFKPKTRLGPRPSMDNRPRSSKSEARPVASLPAGLRAQRSGASPTPSRPKSRDSAFVGFRAPPPPPIPEIPTIIPPRPGSSRASVKSLPATLPKSPGMTPEKARLMKFREIHRQREAKAKARMSAMPDIPPMPVIPKEYAKESKGDAPEPPKAELPKEELVAESSVICDHGKSDSGVCVDESSHEDRVSSAPTEQTEPEATPITTGSSEEQVELPSTEPQPTPSSEQPASINSASSPISVLESSGLVSTRPTSLAESSVHEKADPEPLSPDRLDEVDTPSTVVDNRPAQSPASQSTEIADLDSDPLPFIEHEGSSSSSVRPDQRADEQDAPAPDVSVSAHSRQSSLASVKARRHGMAAPLTVNVSDCSDADYDDDLMDELDSAEVVEAKSISVSKSPISPFFPRRPSTNFSVEGKSSPYITAMPARVPSPQPPSPRFPPEGFGANMVRSPSGTLLSPLPQHHGETIALAKEVKIGTGIAAKIADLQRSFSRGSTASLTPSPNSRTAETAGRPSVYQRASALRTTPPRASSAGWQHKTPASKASFSSVDTESPERERPHLPLNIPPTIGSRISVYNQPPEKPTKPDTVSVTATIVRADNPQPPSLLPPTAYTPLELHESPLIVTHERAQPPAPIQPPAQPQIREHRAQSTVSLAAPTIGRSESTTSLATATSPTETTKEPSGPARRSTDSGWRLGRRLSRSEAKSPTSPTLVRSLSNTSLDTAASGDSGKENKEEKKKGSRASRLIRRMSNSMSSLASVSRLSLGQLSPTAQRADDAFMPPISPVLEAPPRPLPTDIGDLNVQFPDTLLWKRRWVEIDAQGFIVLKPYGANDRATAANGIVKKYPLNEFNSPFAPDLERQEMPNSIILDFKDGRTLQLSCQSPTGQKAVLKCKFTFSIHHPNRW